MTQTASAAKTGASATERFKADRTDGATVTSTDRVDLLAREVLAGVHETVRRNHVTYDEYNALKAWLINVGETGEWPLFLDVWLEHVVEEVNTAHREGSKGTIEGPFYVPGAPEMGPRGSVPMRDDEAGSPLAWSGQVTSVDGAPLGGAVVEIWHADSDGFYSQFAPGIPEWNLRGTFEADDDGRFEVTTVMPAPYQIPTDGPCGALISAAGWHAWRPAHIHVKVSHPGSQLLTAQLYFPNDEHNEDDIASAVKPELMFAPQDAVDGVGTVVEYDFVLDPT